MTKAEAVRIFKEYHPHMHKEAKDDYCKMQFEWSCFVDSLCKNGEITEHQYDTWTTPF